jgi:hypothetical protein
LLPLSSPEALNSAGTIIMTGNLPNIWWAGALCGLALVVPPEAYAERLAIKAYTTADGLPSTFVQHIVQDSHGFLHDQLCSRDAAVPTG